jgi:hypothetical protein
MIQCFFNFTVVKLSQNIIRKLSNKKPVGIDTENNIENNIGNPHY